MSKKSQPTGFAAVLAAIRDFFCPRLERIERHESFLNYPVELEVISAANISEASNELQQITTYEGDEIYIPADKYYAEMPNAAPAFVTLIIAGVPTASYMICKSVTNGSTTFTCQFNIEGYTIGIATKSAGSNSWIATSQSLAS
ncbi:MAG: hypothetical protein II825_11340 [Paludibacteraceae bacterium]|nr:hypothetical protein [Paludibacteraceae bacterium]MBQ6777368.1 hypothetical protein [Paludibacteraceae bacterium]